MFTLSTFWACFHLQSTETIELNPPSSRKPKHPTEVPLRPAIKYLEISCPACRDIPTTPEDLVAREYAQRFVSETVNAEANRVKQQYLRERWNATAKRYSARKVAANRAAREWKVQHGKCEGCGSALEQLQRDWEPTCAMGCHKLWKVVIKASEPVIAPPTWDKVVGKYLGKTREKERLAWLRRMGTCAEEAIVIED